MNLLQDNPIDAFICILGAPSEESSTDDYYWIDWLGNPFIDWSGNKIIFWS